MSQLPDLGRALALLRTLHGFSPGECAARIGVTVERLAATERGEIAPGDLERIAGLYALDQDELREGVIRPVGGVEGATIFLLQGAYADFDARDLDVFERALSAARHMTELAASLDDGRAGLRQRLQFIPTAPAGPKPADAARQGYKLARLVRARLGLGAKPIADIRVLLEEQLGIAVVVDDLISQELRASSILDMHRAAAAAVLAPHQDIEQNPLLARVYLAHELAHVLFDPGAPGTVRIALDTRLDGHASLGAAANQNGLMESRAKGFAAELLIPLEGVTTLLGAPGAPESSLAPALKMVAQVRERFGTPWEIAAYHLTNLGFIQKELTLGKEPTLGLLRQKSSFPGVPPPTSLPAPRAMPRLLERMLTSGAGSGFPAAAVPDENASERADEPPLHVRAARRTAQAVIEDLGVSTIAAAYDAVERGQEIEAVDMLSDYLDDRFRAGEFDAAGKVLAQLDPHRLPPQVLTGVLMITSHAREELGQARVEFFARGRSALVDTWRLSSTAIDDVDRRLA